MKIVVFIMATFVPKQIFTVPMKRPDENEFPLQRRKTVTVNVGGVPMGSDHPVRIQSMANTSTGDIEASMAQCIRIIKAGADYVRFTVPSMNDVDAIAAIRQQLRKQGYPTPIIADVHFSPDIALKVAAYVDKVRINPGNFADIAKFRELLEICRANGTAIRIGVNHGSLSDRIMDEFGDTPEGMAESAMEFLRICREKQFDQVVVSMMELPPGCSGAHDPEFYIKTLREILDSGLPYDSICFKDASGTSNPKKVYDTIWAARKLLGEEAIVWMHTHETAGVGISQYQAAIEAGCDGVCLARSLAQQPEVILLDEPTSGLDPISTGKVEAALQELKKDYTIILVPHSVQQDDGVIFFEFL